MLSPFVGERRTPFRGLAVARPMGNDGTGVPPSISGGKLRLGETKRASAPRTGRGGYIRSRSWLATWNQVCSPDPSPARRDQTAYVHVY